MTDRIITSNATATRRTPWHLWAVGLLTLLFNAGGAFDYTMTQMRADFYMGQFTDEQRAYFEGFPAWFDAFWALGVWGALAGSVLLLARSRFALPAFLVAIVGLVASTLYQFVLADMPDSLMTPATMLFSAVIWLVTLSLALYARAMIRSGVLR